MEIEEMGETTRRILDAIPWRCFHCDFITMNQAEAAAHFGDRDDAEEFKPICRWWNRMTGKESIEALQDVIKDLNFERSENSRNRSAIEGLEYQVGRSDSWKGYRPFRKCTSMYEVFCEFDSMEGRALAAEERLKAFESREAKS